MLLVALPAWLDREQRDVIAYLREENRAMKLQRGCRRLQLDDRQRRRLAVLGHRLRRHRWHEFATLVTPDTILRWHRDLVARK
jgi:putative transposase